MSKAIPTVQENGRGNKNFTQRYRERKNERNLLDFNDLEHLHFAEFLALKMKETDGRRTELYPLTEKS